MKSFLFVLTSFVAVTSLLSGLLMISNPDGEAFNLSIRLLKGTPFRDFKIPGILLATLVGATNLAASLFIIIRRQKRYVWSLTGGILLCGWVIAEIAMIDTPILASLYLSDNRNTYYPGFPAIKGQRSYLNLFHFCVFEIYQAPH
jgi:hypothetical protein